MSKVEHLGGHVDDQRLPMASRDPSKDVILLFHCLDESIDNPLLPVLLPEAGLGHVGLQILLDLRLVGGVSMCQLVLFCTGTPKLICVDQKQKHVHQLLDARQLGPCDDQLTARLCYPLQY